MEIGREQVEEEVAARKKRDEGKVAAAHKRSLEQKFPRVSESPHKDTEPAVAEQNGWKKIEAKDLVNAGFSQYADKTKRMIVDNIPREFSKLKLYHAAKMSTIFTAFEYAIYYNEAKTKYGDDSRVNHAAAASQTAGSLVLSGGAGWAAGAATGYILAGAGIAVFWPVILVGGGAAVATGLIYDNYNINGKPASAWIGDTAKEYIESIK